ncbi:nucleotide exchange factor GrpE [Miniphocaeibacter massiliensis]|uniref:nucleotide exchange factor GrpE n=1 Tax=Miniphocaeibacter massiliensis TaxID=2041841 RepID=UPI001F5C1BA1|nr:nucleotide exchange factor GrpE [Miniphocaeibacter massiliensis]
MAKEKDNVVNDDEIINEEVLNSDNIDEEEGEDVLKEDLDETEQLKNSLAILQADFMNFKNRIEKEKSQSIALANEGLILKLLPILDDLERGYEHKQESNEFTEGIKIIIDNFKEVLSREGLEEIKSNNMPFDHNLHQAILMEPSDEYDSGTIMETFQKGYKLNNKVIRPSMVKVSE